MKDLHGHNQAADQADKYPPRGAVLMLIGAALFSLALCLAFLDDTPPGGVQAGERTAGEMEYGCPAGTDLGYGVYEDCTPVLVPCERPDHATRLMFSLVLYLVDGADVRAFWSLVGAHADQCNQADASGGVLPAALPGR